MHGSDGGEHAGIDQWEASVHRITEPCYFPFFFRTYLVRSFYAAQMRKGMLLTRSGSRYDKTMPTRPLFADVTISQTWVTGCKVAFFLDTSAEFPNLSGAEGVHAHWKHAGPPQDKQIQHQSPCYYREGTMTMCVWVCVYVEQLLRCQVYGPLLPSKRDWAGARKKEME